MFDSVENLKLADQPKKVLKSCHTGIWDDLLDLDKVEWKDLQYKNTGDTALHVASRYGHPEVIKRLLNRFNSTAVDATNYDNKTPLHEAAQFGQLESATILIEHGANVNSLKKADWTPLMLACTKKPNLDLIKALSENGAAVNYANKDGWTCLHLLAREGSHDNLKYLHSRGLNLSLKTKNGRSGTHVSALHNNQEVLQYLLKEDPSQVNATDNCGNTPLHESVIGGNYQVFKNILESGGEIGANNSVGFNALHLAACQGDLDFIRIILGLGVNVDSQSIEGYTALHCAARKNLMEPYRLLLDMGASSVTMDYHERIAEDYLRG